MICGIDEMQSAVAVAKLACCGPVSRMQLCVQLVQVVSRRLNVWRPARPWLGASRGKMSSEGENEIRQVPHISEAIHLNLRPTLSLSSSHNKRSALHLAHPTHPSHRSSVCENQHLPPHPHPHHTSPAAHRHDLHHIFPPSLHVPGNFVHHHFGSFPPLICHKTYHNHAP